MPKHSFVMLIEHDFRVNNDVKFIFLYCPLKVSIYTSLVQLSEYKANKNNRNVLFKHYLAKKIFRPIYTIIINREEINCYCRNLSYIEINEIFISRNLIISIEKERRNISMLDFLKTF